MVRTSQPGENSHYSGYPIKRSRLYQPIHEDLLILLLSIPFTTQKPRALDSRFPDRRRPINPDQIYYMPLKADSGSSAFS
jgi:hypothetical protein